MIVFLFVSVVLYATQVNVKLCHDVGAPDTDIEELQCEFRNVMIWDSGFFVEFI